MEAKCCISKACHAIILGWLHYVDDVLSLFTRLDLINMKYEAIDPP